MPILIKRANGKATPLINSEYLSAYYLFPKDLLEKCGRELSELPRVPMRAIYEKQSINVIESDLFRLLMMDGFSHLVWPFMDIKGHREIYSGYDPAYILSHSPGFWVQELLDRKIILDSVAFVKQARNNHIGYISWDEVSAIMSEIVPDVMKKHKMNEVIETAKEFRCFEDFDYRDSNQKRDLFRKWYHIHLLIEELQKSPELAQTLANLIQGNNK